MGAKRIGQLRAHVQEPFHENCVRHILCQKLYHLIDEPPYRNCWPRRQRNAIWTQRRRVVIIAVRLSFKANRQCSASLDSENIQGYLNDVIDSVCVKEWKRTTYDA